MSGHRAHLAPIAVELWIAAPRESVFAYFTVAEKHREWIGDTVEIDARPGGLYRCTFSDRRTVEGEFLEVTPPKRVVYTWGWVGSDEIPVGSTRVEVTLEPEHGGTRVRLSHAALPTSDARARHSAGWSACMRQLAERLGG